MSALKPEVDSTHDLGTTALRWRNLFVDGITVTDDITVAGNLTVEGATTTVTTTDLQVSDRLISLGSGSTATTSHDIGFIGRHVGSTITAGSFVTGRKYRIKTAGNTTFTDVGAADNDVGTEFEATGAGAGTGTADEVVHVGLFNDRSASKFRLFSTGEELDGSTPAIEIDPTHASYSASTLVVLDLEATQDLDVTRNSTIGGTLGVTSNATFSANVTVGTAVLPDADDGAVLGSNTRGWSDLFLTETATISFLNNAADAVDLSLTHSEGALTLSTTDKLQFNDAGTFIHSSEAGQLDLSADGAMVDAILLSAASGGIKLGAGGDIVLDADGDNITFKAGNDDTSGLSWTQSASGTWTHKVTTEDADLIFNVNTSAGGAGDQEVLRLDGSAGSLLMREEHKIEFRDSGVFAHSNAAGQFTLSADGDSADAVNIIASDAAGGIDIDAGTGGIAIDSGAGVISIGSNGADAGNINLGTSTGARTITVGNDNSTKVDVNATAVELDAGSTILLDGGIDKDNGFGVSISASHADGAMRILSGTGGIEINATGEGAGSGDGAINISSGANSTISAAADLGISTTSSGNLTLSSAAELDIDAGDDITVDTVNANTINIGTSTVLTKDSSDINIGTNDTSGVERARTITIGHDDSTKVDVNAKIIELDSAGTLDFDAASTAATAVTLDSAGGIDITATGAAGKDIDVSCTSGSVRITAGEATADAVVIDASAAGGGIDIIAGDAANDANSDISITASNALTIDAQGTDAGDGVAITLGTDTANAQFKILNNSSSEKFKVDGSGAILASGTLTVGADNTGHDVQFYGATAGKHLLWDESADELALVGSGTKLSFFDAAGGENISADDGGILSIAAGTQLSLTSPTLAVTSTTAVTIATPSLQVSSATVGKPTFEIINTADDQTGCELKLKSTQNGTAGVSGDVAGKITFFSNDDAEETPNNQAFGRMQTKSTSVTSGSETGEMAFAVATSASGDLADVLTISGGATAAASTVTIAGNLNVQGTSTTVNVTDLTVADKTIVVAKDAADAASTHLSGLVVDTVDESLLWNNTSSYWASTAHFNLADGKEYYINGASVLTAAGSAKVQSGVAGDGLSHSNGVLAVSVDDSSIETSGDSLRVKESGITNAMLNGSIANAKLANSSVTVTAGDGLTGGGEVTLGGAAITLAVSVDDSSIEIDSDTLQVKASGITNAMLEGSIADSKLNQITTADKVAGSAVQLSTNSAIENNSGLELKTNIAGDGLAIAEAGGNQILSVGVDDSSIEINSDALRVKASGITNAMLEGSIANDKLASSSITLGDGSNSTAISLGGTVVIQGTNQEVEVSESSGTFTVGLPNDVTINGDLTVDGIQGSGNISTTGNISSAGLTATGASIRFNDTLLQLGNNNSANKDHGFYSERGEDSFVGFVFDETHDEFRCFTATNDNFGSDDNTDGSTGYALADLSVKAFSASGTATVNSSDGSADLVVQNNGSDVFKVDAGAGTATVTGSLTSTGVISGDLRTTTDAPAAADSTGTTGDIAVDSNYIYICVDTDTWKRVAIATW